MWMTLSSADIACRAVIKCGWHCQVQTKLVVPSSNVDDTVKCRHSLPCRHQMRTTLSSADTACHAVIKCGWHFQVQTQLAMPSSNVHDTVKCRHNLPCHHQTCMTLSSADTACHAIIKCGWHWQVQIACLAVIKFGWLYQVQTQFAMPSPNACHAIIKCAWHCQVQIQLAVPSLNAHDTVKCRHSVPCHHQMWMTLSSADTATIIKHGWHISWLLFHFPFIFIFLLRHSPCSNINICIIFKSYSCSLLNINYPLQIIVSPGLIFTSVNT